MRTAEARLSKQGMESSTGISSARVLQGTTTTLYWNCYVSWSGTVEITAPNRHNYTDKNPEQYTAVLPGDFFCWHSSCHWGRGIATPTRKILPSAFAVSPLGYSNDIEFLSTTSGTD